MRKFIQLLPLLFCFLSSFSQKNVSSNILIESYVFDGIGFGNYTIDNPFSGDQNNYTIDYHVNNTLTAKEFIVAPLSSVEFTAGKQIRIKPGFHAQNGSNFHGYIDELNWGCGVNSTFIDVAPITTVQESTNDAIKVNAEEDIVVTEPTLEESHQIVVFPNPTAGEFVIQSNNEKINTVLIYSLDGQLVMRYNAIDSMQFRVKQDLKKGTYLLQIEGANFSKVNQLVVL